MINILLDKLPESVKIDSVDYPIKYGFKDIIKIEILMFGELPDEEKFKKALNMFYMGNIPKNEDQAVEKLLWFFYCGKLKKNSSTGGSANARRAYCFESDAPYIYSAFQSQYNINLNKINSEALHWWEFSAMFDNLHEEHQISRIIYYRTADLKGLPNNQKKFIKQMRKKYELKKPDSGLDNETRLAKRNADMKAYVKRRMQGVSEQNKMPLL